MRSAFLFALLLLAFQVHAQKRIVFKSTLEIGTFTFLQGTVTVDPGPGWKGYYLPRNGKTGFQIRTVNGILIHGILSVGAGVGYARYDQYNGINIFGDFRMDLLKKRITPFVYFSPGYSHFWNQYENGRGTSMLDLGLGLSYRVRKRNRLSLSTGLLMMQQSAYIPARLGISL